MVISSEPRTADVETNGHSETPSLQNGPPSSRYDKDYYDSYGAKDESGAPIVRPYRRGTSWDQFFAHLADCVVGRLRPKTALDVGCALGLLVEALRERGVDARGFDVSEWAISQVPEALRPFCRVSSLGEEIEGRYDLITCIEVIEHLPAHEAPEAIANICRHTDTVLFSSSPSDFEEPTHMNVQPPDYWVAMFAEHGFFRDTRHDAGYVAPHACVFRRQEWSMADLAEHYDRAWWQLQQTLLGVQGTRDRLAEQLDGARRSPTQLQPQLEEAVEAQRRAESDLLELQQIYDRLLADLATPSQLELADDDSEPWWLKHRTFVALQASRDRFATERDEACRTLSALRSQLAGAEEGRSRAEAQLAELGEQLSGVRARLEADSKELERMRHTKLFRYTAPVRRMYARLRRGG